MLTYEQYQEKKKLLASGGDFSPEAVAKVQSALDEYDNNFLAKGAAADEKPLAPGEPDRILSVGAPTAPLPTTNEGLAQQLVNSLDPSKPLAPQVLAIQPATTHPKGDDVAKDEWLRGELDNPKGTVIAYDAPVAIARKELLENPALFKAMGYDAPLTPDKVMSIRQGDSVHQAYNDMKWREAANAATAAGKTAYRYSKAPYLPDGKGAGLLDTLSTKLKAGAQPYGEGVTAFILGVDKGADFGAGRAAQEAINPTVNEPTFGQDQTGGIPQGLDSRQHNAILQEEHPNLYLGGEALGTLAPWSVANKLFGAVFGGVGKALAPEGANLLQRGAAEIAGSAAGTGAIQAANEGVKAASNLQQTGSAGTTLPEAASRVGDAADMGALGGTLGAGAQALGGWVRTGARYGGLPETVEKLNGGKVYPIVGHATPPVVREAEQAARARSMPVEPVDILAERAQQPLTDAAKAHVQDTNRVVGEATSAVKASPEGQQLIPAQKTAEESLRQLRERTASNDGSAPTPVGTPRADLPVKGIFNSNIEGVSVTPRKGWLRMKVSEAESFLSPVMRKRAIQAADTGEPVMRAGVEAPPADLATVPEPGGLAAREQSTGITPSPAEPGTELASASRPEAPPPPELRAGGEIQKAPTDAMVRGSRPPTAAELEGAPKVTAREIPTARDTAPPNARWQRRASSAEPRAPETGEDWRAKIKPGTFSEEMGKRGIDTLYVAPRRYDAEHHESVLRQLRRSGADTANDRDLKAIYQAALEDRDARTLDGVPGGWSALQQQHQGMIREAKATQKLAAPNEDAAYRNVVNIANQAPGQSKSVRALEDTAARAGGDTLDVLRGARVMGPLAKVQAAGSFGNRIAGSGRGLFGLSALGDAMMLRGIYPVTRAAEQFHPGRLANVGADDQQEIAKRRARDQALVPGYEQQTAAAAPKQRPKVKRRPLRKD